MTPEPLDPEEAVAMMNNEYEKQDQQVNQEEQEHEDKQQNDEELIELNDGEENDQGA